MKRLLYLILVVFTIQLFDSCEKIIPDLERDNPYDTAYVGNDENKIRVLEYYSHNVACKEEGTPPYIDYSDEDTIKAGDKIWLNIKLKNSCNFDISGIRATITSASNLVSIEPLSSSYYLKFGDASDTDDIGSGKTGWGEIKSGSYYHSAPNYNSYSVVFTVSSDANTGDKILLNLSVSDEIGNNWDFGFNVTLD